jgi:hypothetical protein
MRAMPRFSIKTVFPLFLIASFNTHAVETSLCTAAEETVFACSVAGGRLLSICATPQATGGAELVYRYGSLKKTELSIAALTMRGAGVIDGWQTEGARGGDAAVRFRNGDYSYVVQDLWTGPSPGDPGCPRGDCGFVGARVQKGAKVVSEKRCVAPVQTFKSGALARLGVPEGQ